MLFVLLSKRFLRRTVLAGFAFAAIHTNLLDCYSVRVPPSRNVYRGCCTRKGVFNLTRTGIEQHGPAKQGKQSAQWAVA